MVHGWRRQAWIAEHRIKTGAELCIQKGLRIQSGLAAHGRAFTGTGRARDEMSAVPASEEQPPVLAKRRGRWLGPIAAGVSRPPWSLTQAGTALLISLAGIKFLPEALDFGGESRWQRIIQFWPELTGHIPMFVCLWYLARKSGTTVGAAFGLRTSRIGKVIVSGLLLFLVEMLITGLVGVVLLIFGVHPGPSEATRETREAARSIGGFLDVSIVTGFCEELAFRGLVYTTLRLRLNVAVASVLTAGAFALMHPVDAPLDFATLAVPAVFSSLWYERTRSLWPGMISHALQNAVVTVL
jgi:membrane protease YdiL (CAAX protease family)